MNKILNTWTFGGVRLSSFGAVTELNSYLDTSMKRSQNVVVPLVDGAVHAHKYFDQRIVSFGIEISADNICDLEIKFDALKLLLGSRSQQYLEYWSPTGLRRAYAEVVGQLGVTRNPDPLVAKVIVDFLLAEPFFRSMTLLTHSDIIDASPMTFAPILNNPGTIDERRAIITLTGPLSSTKITNSVNGVWLLYDAVITAGHHVDIDCGLFTALYDNATNVLGSVYHSGDTSFMVFLPGDNPLTITDLTHTTGTVAITFYPPYL